MVKAWGGGARQGAAGGPPEGPERRRGCAGRRRPERAEAGGRERYRCAEREGGEARRDGLVHQREGRLSCARVAGPAGVQGTCTPALAPVCSTVGRAGNGSVRAASGLR